MILKRFFDVIVSILALIVLLPLFIVIAIFIKIDSKGPVFFRQERVGLNGKIFRIYKFRTMTWNVLQNGLQITVAKDPRITRVGYFLRKYKFDELAQFLNVLIGQMSIVGPRPEVPHYMEQYPDLVRNKVLSMRPGITDKASIEFRNENEMLNGSKNPDETYIEIILPIKQRYYLEYIDNNTMLGDLLIIWQTFLLVFVKK